MTIFSLSHLYRSCTELSSNPLYRKPLAREWGDVAVFEMQIRKNRAHFEKCLSEVHCWVHAYLAP